MPEDDKVYSDDVTLVSVGEMDDNVYAVTCSQCGDMVTFGVWSGYGNRCRCGISWQIDIRAIGTPGLNTP